MLEAVGAVLAIAGCSIRLGRLSGHRLSRPPDNQNSPSLEPRGQGLKFLGLTRKIPTIVLIVVGGIMLLYAD